MYDVQKGEPVFSIADFDTGICDKESPAVESDLDVLLDRLSELKGLPKADAILVKWGKSHRTEIGDDYVVIDFNSIGGKRIAKCHFFAKRKGTQKDGDLYKITVVNGVMIEERIRLNDAL